MFGYRLDDAKRFFFDRETVTSRLSKAKLRVFNRVGGLTRRISRNSIRPASRRGLKRIAELRGKLRNARGKYRAELLRELRQVSAATHSRPGKPPKSITKRLKDGIFYAYDSGKESVVIGPVKLNKSSGAQETLEFGGQAQIGPNRVEIEPRPYMGPAGDKVAPQIAGFFRDSL